MPTPRNETRGAAASREWRGVLSRIATGVALAGVCACASGPAPEPQLRLTWPPPPDAARIEHVSLIRHPFDVVGPPGFWTRFGGFLGLETGFGRDWRPIVQPMDVETSADGEVVYVADFASGVVHVFDFAQQEVRYIGEEEQLARPAGLAVDAQQRVWIVEQQKRQIRIVNAAGATLRMIRSDKLRRPLDIELDEARGLFYVSDPAYQRSKDHYVHRFSIEGEHLGLIGDGRGTAEGQLLFPTYLAVGKDGSLYVSDTMNARISKFDASGRFERTIGARGDGFGLFDKPKGIDLDSFGNLYVADSSWSNVQVFGPLGDVLIFFGGRGGHPGQLRNPTGLSIHRPTNRIYVGDYLNRRVGRYRLINTQMGDGVPSRDDATSTGP